jgi:pyruvate dehydrogenase E2 component (dihydrolipoamide acetyltransferase)
VRALARKLEVDLASVQGSGPDGTITRADVERAARSLSDLGPAEPLRGMRRAMALRMAAAHREVVPATVTDEADIGDWGAGEDITIRLVRAIAAACKSEPSLNAWYMAAGGERRLIARIDVGIAVDTEGGLIVPVLRNVAERDARDLRAGLDRLRADAAARAIPPDELRGATITLSNFGMIGGRFANLVVVPPQVAIVGAGRTTKRVVVHEDQPAVRRVLPLSLTFDHRVVTGGEAARFLAALRADIERPC